MFEIDAETFATVLEYCPGIDLDMYLKKNKVNVTTGGGVVCQGGRDGELALS